jgi:hypothetical protein
METTAITYRETTKFNVPVMVFTVLLTWALSAGVTYGVLSTRIDWLAQRMDGLERQSAQNIQRPEYETEKSDLDSRLDRIERKIDALK